MLLSLAAISRCAVSAGTSSRSNGKTNSVPAPESAGHGAENGRTNFSIKKCSSPLKIDGESVYAYTDLKPIPNRPI